jgi:hypothetical protein
LHGCAGLGIICHFDESETARAVGVAVGHDGDGLNRSVRREEISQLCFGGRGIQIPNEDVNHDSLEPLRPVFATVEKRRGDLSRYRLSAEFVGLESLNVFGLQALGALGDIELHGLAFLQALESASLDGREMHENVFASLTADKAVPFGVIEPLYCSLFHVFCTLVPLVVVTLEGFGRNLRRLLAVEARTAQDRFGLTHVAMLPGMYEISNGIRVFALRRESNAAIACRTRADFCVLCEASTEDLLNRIY